MLTHPLRSLGLAARRLGSLAVFATLSAAVFTPTSARAEDRWTPNKGDCEEVFASWNTQSLKRLRDCTMRWEMYRDVSRIDDDTRSVVQSALEKLYAEGSERDAVMALSALKRLGLRPKALRESTVAVPKEAPPEDAAPVVEDESPPQRKGGMRGGVLPAPEVVPEASPMRAPSRRGSQEAVAQGNRMYKAGQPAEALTQYLIAVDEDPTYAPPLYLAAMTFARLGKPDMAIDYLKQLH
jgi:tetratricopeptide (TPR) repeat protein